MDTTRQSKNQVSIRQIKSVTCLSVFVNIALAVSKLVIGLLFGSLAVVADAVHSVSDIVTDVAVFIGVHFGSKEPDSEHPYGHGRMETFSSIFVAMALLAVGAAMVFYAALNIAKEKVLQPNASLYIVTIASIVFKELLYQMTRRVAVKTNSSATYANAWHHRSDALSSVAVLIGIIALKFGFHYGDQVAAIAVGIMIILVAVNVIGSSISELAESSVDEGTVEHIKQIIKANSQIRQYHHLRTRTIGREVFLDLHILVDPDLSISSAHEISEKLETTLHEQISRPVNIVVHIEPDIPSLRK